MSDGYRWRWDKDGLGVCRKAMDEAGVTPDLGGGLMPRSIACHNCCDMKKEHSR